MSLARIIANTIAPDTRDRFLGIDYREYFHAFVEAHGEPVRDGKLLLFPDGWAYSAYSYRGPEFPAPSDPAKLHTRKITYWRLRRELVTKLKVHHGQRLRRLEGMSAAKDLADETRERLTWLDGEAAQCDEMLNQLSI